MKYTLAIDETGRFNPNNFGTVVGILTDMEEDSVKNIFISEVKKFNDTHPTAGLLYPEHMHAAVLCEDNAPWIREQRNVHNITMSTELGKEFVQSLLAVIGEKPGTKVFHTIGTIPYFIHEQEWYFRYLNTMVLGAPLEAQLQNTDLDVIIGSRRGSEHLRGEFGAASQYNMETIERIQCEHFEKALKECANVQTNSVTILPASRSSLLMLADFCCWGIRNNAIKNTIVSLNVSDEMFYTQNSPQKLFDSVEGGAEGLFRVAAMAGKYSAENATNGKDIFNDNYPKLLPTQQSELFKRLEAYVGEILLNRPQAPDRLKDIPRILELLPGNDHLSRYFIAKYEMFLMSHAIQCKGNAPEEFRKVVREHADKLFPDPTQQLKEVVENELQYAQYAWFNNLDFSDNMEFEKSLGKQITILKELDSIFDRKVDNLRARISGTLGQAYEFRAERPGLSSEDKELYSGMAETYLEEDAGLLEKGSYFWSMVNNYLVAHYWKSGQLDKALMKHLYNKTNPAPADLLALDKPEWRQSTDGADYFIFLNHLRLTAAFLEAGTITITEETSQNIIASFQDFPIIYPGYLCAKWAAYILALTGNGKIGAEKLGKFHKTKWGLPLEELMRANILLTKALIGEATNSNQHITEAGRIIFSIRESTAKNFANKYEWITYLEQFQQGATAAKRPDLRSVVMGLPYYFA